MTKQEILKNNEIIARFTENHSFQCGCLSDFTLNELPDSINKRYLKYHRNWNQLMNTVAKINARDWVTIYADECKIHSLINGEFEDIQIISEGEPLIETVYKAVLTYINWYNENQ